MRGAVLTGLHLLPFVLTLTAVAWFLAQSPFSAPMVQATTAQIDRTLTRAMARDVDRAWLLPRVQDALLAEDLMRLDLLLGLANDHGVVLPRELIEDIAALDAATSGFVARTTGCGACAVDITACETLSQISLCAIPFELTPAGDVNALRRAGVDYLSGGDIDRLDVGLAVIGLGATGAVLATGGSSYSVKAGASVLRAARRLGMVTPALAARLTSLVGDAVRWDRLGDLARGRAAPQDLIVTAKMEELTGLGRSLGRMADTTSVAEAMTLLRFVDTPQEAARLARVTDAIGPRTRGAIEVLGKSRVLRATVRISNLAIGAAAALYLAVLQVLIFCGQQGCNLCIRSLRRRMPRQI
ncbi:hypothetical protein [Pseudooctadecabacter jejudonensis]|uniref:Uncharacterized protein n=1 Tax=Pseudooctadecabacter jejudonensis TaxID=1391910 RepID=A0A1Y5SZ24_9RHOB|nr:hypothetical protein [Pseudooctadecabacter jejudonensis]SLN51994.1 hypothetical protein PSJ8397_02748 [Pseudooctadecabacter jejudonensis]